MPATRTPAAAATSRAATQPDHRSPFVVDTRELGRRPGSMRELTRSLTAPEGWWLGVAGVRPGDPAELSIRLEAVMEGVYVSGTLAADIAGECGRCLEPLTAPLEVELQELFGYDPDPDDPDRPVIAGDLIDLEGLVRDAVVLELPTNPLCSPDCEGLCAECGQPLAGLPDDHAHDDPDPRWAALAGLTLPGSPDQTTQMTES